MYLCFILQSLHDGFDEWLSKCEGEVSLPIRLEGDPREIRQQMEAMKVSRSYLIPRGEGTCYLLSCSVQALADDIEQQHPQLKAAVSAGKALEDYTTADSAMLPDIGYTALEERYNALQV